MITTLAQVSIAPLDTHVSAFRLIQSGGWLMVLLGFLSIAAMGVFIERFFYFKRSRMNVNEFLAGVLALISRRSYNEAIARCEEGHGPLVGVVRTAIYKRHLPPNELREIVREIAQLEIPQLEANISLLATIGYVAPLLGLFGTVSGMIEAFIKINRTSGTASVADLSQGIYQALVTTAGGLAIAVPCYIAYNFLVAQVHSITADMERAGIETIHTLTDTPRTETIEFKPEADEKKQKQA